MPFLSASGIEIPVAVDTFTEEVREVGSTVQAFSGALVRSRIATKRDIEFEVPLTANTLAGQYERWLRGEGEMWTFTNLYGSKGTGPESGYSGTIQASSGISGTGNLTVASGSHAYRIAPAGSSWTFAVWYSTAASPSYTHYVVTSAGNKWVDGVSNNGASTTWAAVSNGILTLTGGTDRRWDNLFAFPATVDSTWPPIFYGTAGNGDVASGAALMPYLNLTGDAILETTRSAMGEVMGTSVLAADGSTRRKLTVRLAQR
jgi:hypothetical protein